MSRQRQNEPGVWINNLHCSSVEDPNAVLGFWKAKLRKETTAALQDLVDLNTLTSGSYEARNSPQMMTFTNAASGAEVRNRVSYKELFGSNSASNPIAVLSQIRRMKPVLKGFTDTDVCNENSPDNSTIR